MSTRKPYHFSFRIKRKFLDEIIAGSKTVEFRNDVPFWRNRVKKARNLCGVPLNADTTVFPGNAVQAVFFCGGISHRRAIDSITKVKTPDELLDKKAEVKTEFCWAFLLGAVQ